MKKLDLKKVTEALSMCITEVETAKDNLQEFYDEKSEQWQESDKGQATQSQIDALEELGNNLDNALSEANELIASTKE